MFTDRTEAGKRLAAELQPLAATDPIVLALPRGGVPVGYEVAKALGAPLHVLIVRKLGVPWNPEYAFGAIGEDGARVVDQNVVRAVGMSQQDVERVIAAETAEIARRSTQYRGDRALPDLSGRTVILADDGLATGSTMAAAIAVVRHMGAGRIVVAVPVGAQDSVERIRALADDVVCLETPWDFRAVGLHYRVFDQTSDAEVIRLLERAAAEIPAAGTVGAAGTSGAASSADAAGTAGSSARSGSEPAGLPAVDAEVVIPAAPVRLPGHLEVPEGAPGIVIFAHGSGSSRFSSRNQYVAQVLRDAGLGTLLFDLLTEPEAADRRNVFDIELLAERLVAATEWVRSQSYGAEARIGYFGASTGAGAALVAAARRPEFVSSVVSRGGRPDLAGGLLPMVQAPTLLIVGGNDFQVIELNRAAQQAMRCPVELTIVPGATHLFEEPGTLQRAAELARDHFLATLGELR